VLAGQLRSLVANGSATARHCLGSYLGVVASRNGCRGPWTQSVNVQWRPPLPQRWARRVTPAVYLQNVLAGIDQLAHGSSGLRGWGSPSTPDPVLFVPRGYDATAQRFRYDVNPRFADTRPNRTLLRDPFRVVIDFSFDLSTDYNLQELRRAVEPIKTPAGWQRRSADSITAFYLGNTSSIHKNLLAESDSLFLTKPQIAALQHADSVFSARTIDVYGRLAEYLAQGNGAAGKAELDSMNATGKAYWKIFWEQPEIADSILTPTQKQFIPILGHMVSTPQKQRENSRVQFGHSIKMPPAKPKPVAIPAPAAPGASEPTASAKP